MRERTRLAVGLVFLSACVEPYRPACRPGAEQALSEQPGDLTLHADGQWRYSSTLNQAPGDGGAFELRATVRSFSAAGESIEERTLVVASERRALSAVALTDGFAVANFRSAPDGGGSELLLALFSFDGGVARASVPTGTLGGFGFPVRLAEVGSLLHLSHLGVEGPELVAFARDATVVARRPVETTVVFGPDATVVGRDLVSPRLDVVTSRALSTSEPEVVAWSVGARRWASARMEADSVLVDQFTFDSSIGVPRRVSSGASVTSVALAPTGAGVVFQVLTFEGDEPRSGLWFAAVDADGWKRGPDVSIGPAPSAMGGLSAPPRLAAVGNSSFAVFIQTLGGLTHQQVRCE